MFISKTYFCFSETACEKVLLVSQSEADTVVVCDFPSSFRYFAPQISTYSYNCIRLSSNLTASATGSSSLITVFNLLFES